jgi:hypothetical protein
MAVAHRSYSALLIVCGLLVGLGIVIVSLTNPFSYMFEMPDDCGYPAYASSLVHQGWLGNAAGKPFIVVLSALFGCTSFWSSIILFVICGLATLVALWLVTREFIDDPWLRCVPSFLWGTSLWYAYYSKTHLVVFSAVYLVGIWLVLKSLRTRNNRWYMLGWLTLGCSLLSYYVAVIYLPFFGAYVFYARHLRKQPLLSTLGATCIPFFLPSVILDVIIVIVRCIAKIKNDPFFMVLYWQLRGVTRATGNYDLLYYPRLFAQHESRVVCILIVLGSLVVVYQLSKNNLRAWGLFALFAPGMLLAVRAWQGHLTVPRTFIGVLPILYLVAAYAVYCLLPQKYYVHATAALFLLCGFRLREQWLFLPQLHTGYEQVAQHPALKDAIIVDLGRPFTWELLVASPVTIPLNVHSDPLQSLIDEKERAEIFARIHKLLTNGKKVVFALSHLDTKNYEYAVKIFQKNFKLSLAVHEPAPHRCNTLILEEDNYQGIGALERMRQEVYPWIDVYTISL